MEQNDYLKKLIHDLRAKMSYVNTFLFTIEDLPMDEDTRTAYENLTLEMENMKGVVEEMKLHNEKQL